ncbi:MAG: DUF4112 domain-containing protein [Aestuariivirga sp.]
MTTQSFQAPLFEMTRQGTLARLEKLAWFTDSSITIPGTSRTIGADALLSVVPGIGSVLGAGISAYAVVEAIRHDAPTGTLMRMGGNIALDALVGSIPVVGILFDMAFKANQRNLALLRTHLVENP